LDLDDRFRSLQLLLGPGKLAAQLHHLATERVDDLRLATALCRGQRRQYTSIALLAPGINVRPVQPFAAKQRTSLASARLLVLGENARLVFSSKLTSMPIASLMEPGFDGIATVMEPPDRQGHGATCRVG